MLYHPSHPGIHDVRQMTLPELLWMRDTRLDQIDDEQFANDVAAAQRM